MAFSLSRKEGLQILSACNKRLKVGIKNLQPLDLMDLSLMNFESTEQNLVGHLIQKQ